MGKYMRKAKTTDEVAVMEVSPLGVRTRSRTLALQRLQKPPPPEPVCYLQLRSRRLEKPAAPPPPPSPTPRVRATPTPVNSSSVGSVSMQSCSNSTAEAETDSGAEVSFGETILKLEARDRSVRETTPCSLIMGSDNARTPGSTTRPNSTATSRRTWNRNIPTAHEMEEFFARAEQLQQRIFIEKYNFDPVNDRPLPGRYEWAKLDY